MVCVSLFLLHNTRARWMMCDSTVAQVLVRVIPSMCHAIVCLISLRHLIFYVDRFGAQLLCVSVDEEFGFLVNKASSLTFCVGSCIGAVGLEDSDDEGSCCITAVGCWSSTVILAIDPTIAPTALELSLSFASASVLLNRIRHIFVWDLNLAQPLHPGVAPILITISVVRRIHRCTDEPWSRRSVAEFTFFASSFQGNPRAFSNSLIKNFSSGVTWCNFFPFWIHFL